MLGLVGEATVSRMPWPTYRAVLRVLRPAESAVRRLIVVAARGLVVACSVAPHAGRGRKDRKGRNPAPPSFQLFDRANFPERAPAPVKYRQASRPRIHSSRLIPNW